MFHLYFPQNSYKNKLYNKRHDDRDMGEIFALLGCYAGQIGSYLPKLRDNLSVIASGVKQSCTS
jgi:hypothetical protein